MPGMIELLLHWLVSIVKSRLPVAVPERGGGRCYDLFREMSRANWLWGAPRIHGEPLEFGMP